MSDSEYILAEPNKPQWFSYPTQFLEFVGRQKTSFEPWHLMEAKFALINHTRMKDMYDRELFPIAYRQDNDDTACLEKGHGEEIW